MNKRDDDPIPLATAAADFGIPKGVLKANGLRGELSIYKLGTQYYTTPNAVRRWVEKCHVTPKVRVSGSIRDASNGSSSTERIGFAQDALRQALSTHRSS
jgi:hypothetical protein